MSKPGDYFANHALKLRFPWSLYHAPIVRALAAQLSGPSTLDVLNIGSGPFFELSAMPPLQHRLSICDIDARAIEIAKATHGARLHDARTVEPGAPLPYDDASFDRVVSMDVIEHVVPPGPWLAEALRVLRPGGTLFLTTPNYGSASLAMLENTALELVARAQGFSRKHIHPTKLERASLESLLSAAGARAWRIDELSFGWVLAAHVSK